MPLRTGAGTSLALDGQTEHRYYDQTNHDLKLARKSPARLTVEVVDVTSVATRPSSSDAQGAPPSPYYDATLGDPSLASRAGATWTVVTVDSIGGRRSLQFHWFSMPLGAIRN